MKTPLAVALSYTQHDVTWQPCSTTRVMSCSAYLSSGAFAGLRAVGTLLGMEDCWGSVMMRAARNALPPEMVQRALAALRSFGWFGSRRSAPPPPSPLPPVKGPYRDGTFLVSILRVLRGARLTD